MVLKGMVAMANQRPESDDEFITMQQEAIRRVREMQSRARATLENAGMHIENHSDMPAEPPMQGYLPPISQRATENNSHNEPDEIDRGGHETEEKQIDMQAENNKGEQSEQKEEVDHHKTVEKNAKSSNEKRNDPLASLSHIISNPMVNLSLGSDQIMLMTMIYLLLKDGADKWLILSLAYVLMT